MTTTDIESTSTGLGLSDPALFRDQAYINGAWVDSDSGATYEITNPATGAVIGSAPRMGVTETRRAIEAANAAYPAWRGLLAKERSQILKRFGELMLENQEDLAIIMTSEQGQAARRGTGRDRLRSVVLRVVRRKRRSASTATRFRHRWPVGGWSS